MLLRQARENSGLSLEAAAGQARVSVNYLRRVEASGQASFPLSQRLSRLYSCSANLFVQQVKHRGQMTTARNGRNVQRLNSSTDRGREARTEIKTKRPHAAG